MRRRPPVHEGALTDLERGQLSRLWAIARTDDVARRDLAELLSRLAPRFPGAQLTGAHYAVRLGAWEQAEYRIQALLGIVE